jgi:hypothetical protein
VVLGQEVEVGICDGHARVIAPTEGFSFVDPDQAWRKDAPAS